jgi:hypothetical protein
MMNTPNSNPVEQSFSPAVSGSSVQTFCSSMFRSSGKLAYHSVAFLGMSPLLPVIVLMYAFKFLDESC